MSSKKKLKKKIKNLQKEVNRLRNFECGFIPVDISFFERHFIKIDRVDFERLSSEQISEQINKLCEEIKANIQKQDPKGPIIYSSAYSISDKWTESNGSTENT